MRRTAALLLAAATVTVATCATYSWHNFSGTQQVEPEYMAQPVSIDELVKAVKLAIDNGKRIRMTGSGHSHSDVAVTDEVLLTPTGLVAPLTLAKARLKDPNHFGLVRVQSGITLRALNTYLDTQNLALENMGGYDAQTIVGAAMTGTHGSGLAYGPIASQIRSLQVVGEGGIVYQIEPTNGITNPATFPGKQEENPSIPVTLIQDDKTFNAWVVSLGSFGIVYSVVLQCDKKFWLDERRTLLKWSEVSAPGGLLDRIIAQQPIDDSAHPPEHYELQYNPYAVNGDRSILLTTRTRYDAKPAGDTTRGQPGTDALSGLVVGTSFVIAGIVNTLPDLVPLLIEQALSAQVDTDGYVNDSYNVFNIGKVNETRGMAVEIFLDLADTREGIERAFELADQLRTQKLMHSAPASIRFVKASDPLISMSYGRPSVVIELIVLLDVNNHEDLLKAYEQTLMEEFGGRLHWGLDLDVIQGDAWPKAVYPKWQDWMDVYKQFNKGTFDGAVTDRLGISVRPRL
jgi:hypothetical protein